MSPVVKHQWAQRKWQRLTKLAAVVLVFSLGLWGCARKPAARSAPERIRQLESRCNRLEQEYRGVSAARDRARGDLAEVRREKDRLAKELAEVNDAIRERDEMQKQVKVALAEQARLKAALTRSNHDRDELKEQVALRVTERETLQGRVKDLRQSLKNLLDQDDARYPEAPTSLSTGQ